MLDDRISVVMITRNRGEQIRKALGHLLDLSEKPAIIVVDNGSSDDTVQILRSMRPRVEVIVTDRNLGGAGRNVGVARASTPYVAFSDDDSWWAPGALRRAAALFGSHPSLGLIAARILVGPDERVDPLSRVMATSPLARENYNTVGIPIVGFAACGSIIRRSAFLDAGGFNERFGVGGEEHILALDLLRRGWQLAYIDEVVAHHYPSPVRDPARRRRLEVRNILWSAWLRRPFFSALTITQRTLAAAVRQPAGRAGIREAIHGLSWILRARNPIPLELDRRVTIAEKAFYNMRGSLSDDHVIMF